MHWLFGKLHDNNYEIRNFVIDLLILQIKAELDKLKGITV